MGVKRKKTTRKNIGNKSKYYSKARQWYSVNGSIRVPGFRRVKFVNYRDCVNITTSKGRIKVLKYKNGYADIRLEKPLYAFEAQDGKVLLVTKNRYKAGDSQKLAINAYVVVPAGKAYAPKPLATAKASISKRYKIAYFSDFRWLTDMKKDVKLALAPEWLKGRGFGLFLDSLRHVELARLGVRKWFASILNTPQSKAFAELRGFRKPTRVEAELLVNCVFGEKIQDKEKYVEIVQSDYVIKDISPIKRRQKK